MLKKVLFIDRDGTIIHEPEDFQIDSFEKLSFLPNAITMLAKIANELEYELVMVSNQDGLGTSSFSMETFLPVQNFIINTLKSESVEFADVFIDPSFEHENKPSRKPGTAMLGKYLYGNYDLAQSFVIGDRKTDVQLAENLGCKAIYMGKDTSMQTALNSESWQDIYAFLKNTARIGYCERKTSETVCKVTVNLDGTGNASISTGLPFFDHMLTQIAKHGNIDLEIKVQGDLAIDEHHTIEDTALSLGEALKKALGKKKGIERYGFLLPMDDCLAQVALDFGGRPWLVWDVTFQREKIGDMPTEMFYHFFKSLSDQALCNLNIKAEGENEHHKIESVFKAFAKALRMAISKNENYSIPSTKGTL